MRTYLIVGLGLLIGLEAAWAGEGTDAAPAGQAKVDRLLTQLEQNTLSDAELKLAIKQALGHQAAADEPWDQRWGQLIEVALERKQLPKDQYQEYLDHAAVLSITVRPRIAADDPVVAQVAAEMRLGPKHRLHRVGEESVEIAGQKFAAEQGLLQLALHTGGPRVVVVPSRSARLEPGHHEVIVRGNVHVSYWRDERNGRVVGAFPFELRGKVQVFPAGTELIRVRRDEQLRNAVLNSVQLRKSFLMASLHTRYTFDVVKPPVAVAVRLEPPEDERSLIRHLWIFGPTQTGQLSLILPDRQRTIRLVPDAERAKQTVDVYEIWGEPVELDLHALRQKSPASAPATQPSTESGPQHPNGAAAQQLAPMFSGPAPR